MASYEILIADDHPLFRSALHQALTLGLGPEAKLVVVEGAGHSAGDAGMPEAITAALDGFVGGDRR